MKTVEECRRDVARLLGEFYELDAAARYWVFSFDKTQVAVDIEGAYGAPLVRIGALVARDVPKTAALLEALNAINADLGFARVYWGEDRTISIVETLLAETVATESLMTFLSLVGGTADRYSAQLPRQFGGLEPFA